jgi:hypothetical protein
MIRHPLKVAIAGLVLSLGLARLPAESHASVIGVDLALSTSPVVPPEYWIQTI